jgi:hypothetical protein
MTTDFPLTTPDPWLPLPPEGGKGGTNEMPWNYDQAFKEYGQQTSRQRLTQSDGRRPDSSPLAPIATGVVEVKP